MLGGRLAHKGVFGVLGNLPPLRVALRMAHHRAHSSARLEDGRGIQIVEIAGNVCIEKESNAVNETSEKIR